MTPSPIHRRALGLGLAGLAAATGAATAQSFATRPVRWIVGYPPGGGSDVAARIVAAAVAPGLPQPVVVENRPGASTLVAAEYLAKSAPDGQTVMSAEMGTLVYNRALFRRLPYDPERDFRPVALFARFDFVLVVHPSVPARTVAEFVALAKSRPDGITYASPSVGTPHHLGFERLARAAGFSAVHVPYRGAAAAANDLVAGNVQAMLLDLTTGAPHLGPRGLLRVLAAASSERIDGYPELPTLAEAGFPGAETSSWFGTFLPAATPTPVAEWWEKAITAAMATDPVRQRLREIGGAALTGTGADLRRRMDAEAAVMLPLIRELGLNLDT